MAGKTVFHIAGEVNDRVKGRAALLAEKGAGNVIVLPPKEAEKGDVPDGTDVRLPITDGNGELLDQVCRISFGTVDLNGSMALTMQPVLYGGRGASLGEADIVRNLIERSDLIWKNRKVDDLRTLVALRHLTPELIVDETGDGGIAILRVQVTEGGVKILPEGTDALSEECRRILDASSASMPGQGTGGGRAGKSVIVPLKNKLGRYLPSGRTYDSIAAPLIEEVLFTGVPLALFPAAVLPLLVARGVFVSLHAGTEWTNSDLAKRLMAPAVLSVGVVLAGMLMPGISPEVVLTVAIGMHALVNELVEKVNRRYGTAIGKAVVDRGRLKTKHAGMQLGKIADRINEGNHVIKAADWEKYRVIAEHDVKDDYECVRIFLARVRGDVRTGYCVLQIDHDPEIREGLFYRIGLDRVHLEGEIVDISGQGLGTQLFEILGDVVDSKVSLRGVVNNVPTRQFLYNSYYIDDSGKVRSKIDGKTVVDNDTPAGDNEKTLNEVLSETVTGKLFSAGSFDDLGMKTYRNGGVSGVEALKWLLVRSVRENGKETIEEFTFSGTRKTESILTISESTELATSEEAIVEQVLRYFRDTFDVVPDATPEEKAVEKMLMRLMVDINGSEIAAGGRNYALKCEAGAFGGLRCLHVYLRDVATGQISDNSVVSLYPHDRNCISYEISLDKVYFGNEKASLAGKGLGTELLSIIGNNIPAGTILHGDVMNTATRYYLYDNYLVNADGDVVRKKDGKKVVEGEADPLSEVSLDDVLKETVVGKIRKAGGFGEFALEFEDEDEEDEHYVAPTHTGLEALKLLLERSYEIEGRRRVKYFDLYSKKLDFNRFNITNIGDMLREYVRHLWQPGQADNGRMAIETDLRSMEKKMNGAVIRSADGKEYTVKALCDGDAKVVGGYLLREDDGVKSVSEEPVIVVEKNLRYLKGQLSYRVALDAVKFRDERNGTVIEKDLRGMGLGTALLKVIGSALPDGALLFGEVMNPETRRDLYHYCYIDQKGKVRFMEGYLPDETGDPYIVDEVHDLKHEVSLSAVLSLTLLGKVRTKAEIGANMQMWPSHSQKMKHHNLNPGVETLKYYLRYPFLVNEGSHGIQVIQSFILGSVKQAVVSGDTGRNRQAVIPLFKDALRSVNSRWIEPLMVRYDTVTAPVLEEILFTLVPLLVAPGSAVVLMLARSIFVALHFAGRDERDRASVAKIALLPVMVSAGVVAMYDIISAMNIAPFFIVLPAILMHSGLNRPGLLTQPSAASGSSHTSEDGELSSAGIENISPEGSLNIESILAINSAS